MDEFIKKYKNYQIHKNIKLNNCTDYIFTECLAGPLFFFKYFSKKNSNYDKKFLYLMFLLDLSIFILDIFLTLPNMLKEEKIIDKLHHNKFGESLTHLAILTINSFIVNEVHNNTNITLDLFNIAIDYQLYDKINTEEHDITLIKMKDKYIINLIDFIYKLPYKINLDKDILFREYKTNFNNHLKEKQSII